MVVGMAGLLTQLSVGWIGDVNALPWPVQRALWAEAIECEWAGALDLLPLDSPGADVLACVRSRGMHARIARRAAASAGTAAPFRDGLRLAAARNGWADLVGAVSGADAVAIAAEAGAAWLVALAWPRDGAAASGAGPACGGTRCPVAALHVEAACQHGFLAVVEAIGARCACARAWTLDALVAAAANGHLDVVVWLVRNRRIAPSLFVAALAASRGHKHVADWLTSASLPRADSSAGGDDSGIDTDGETLGGTEILTDELAAADFDLGLGDTDSDFE
nr:hypothetical protein HK105_007071 [Polyrhizophydium stewartii]